MRTIIIVLASLATAASLALAQTTTTPTPTPTGPTTPSTASPFLIEQFLVGSWMVTRTPTSPTPNTHDARHDDDSERHDRGDNDANVDTNAGARHVHGARRGAREPSSPHPDGLGNCF